MNLSPAQIARLKEWVTDRKDCAVNGRDELLGIYTTDSQHKLAIENDIALTQREIAECDEIHAALDAPENQITAKQAVEALSAALQADDGYAISWHANIAMKVYDGCNGRLTIEEANDIADSLMQHLFQAKAVYPV